MRRLYKLLFVLTNLQLMMMYSINCQSATNFVIKEFYWIAEVEQKVKFFVMPKNFNPGLQLVDINFTTPYAVGNNVMVKISLEAETPLKAENVWFPVFSVEDALCGILDTFVGQIAYDGERALGIMPKSCPIPKGRYHAVNHTLNYKTLKLQTFPFGTLRFFINGTEKRTKEKLWSFVVIVMNKA